MAPSQPSRSARAASPMRLPSDELARLYKLTLQVSRALRREVTPTAMLRWIITYGLAVAELEPDFAQKVRDGASPPWKFRRRKRASSAPCGTQSTPTQKKGSRRDLDRRRQ